VLIGGGTTFVARRERAVERIHRITERERIARDLHDVLGHTLSSIALKSELARRLIDRDPKRALAEIADVERISHEALDEVRQAIHGYHAGDIHSEFERVKSMMQAAGVVVEQRCESVNISAEQERVLALVLREAATNIVRHAHAKHCRLALSEGNGAYRLEVSDDGSGMRNNEGIGMRSIRTRVEALGGTASWNSKLGTELVVTVPITPPEH
jgi:two-component system, NarL family, sensor histidine kinase DesK